MNHYPLIELACAFMPDQDQVLNFYLTFFLRHLFPLLFETKIKAKPAIIIAFFFVRAMTK